MTETTVFVGLDVHKKTIAVATVEARASADVRFYGTITNTPEAIRSLLNKLTKNGERLHLCYEAGPLGYGVHRQSTKLGHGISPDRRWRHCRDCRHRHLGPHGVIADRRSRRQTS